MEKANVTLKEDIVPKLIKDEAQEAKKGVFEQLLHDRALTIFGLSRSSGVAERTLRRIVRRQKVRGHVVRKLAAALGMETGDLLNILAQDGTEVADIR